MKEISLSQDQVTIVDDEDYEYLSQFKWYAYKSPSGCFYAVRNYIRDDGAKRVMRMHNAIMGLAPSPELTVDHRAAKSSLDNRRSNLRWATKAQQRWNVLGFNSKSGLKGVYWVAQTGKWRAAIGVKGKQLYLGCYDSPETAYEAYCEAATRMHGEFAQLQPERLLQSA